MKENQIGYPMHLELFSIRSQSSYLKSHFLKLMGKSASKMPSLQYLSLEWAKNFQVYSIPITV